MRSQQIYLHSYDWTVLIFYNVPSSKVDVIRRHLQSLGCHSQPLEDACLLVSHSVPDTAFTYTNISFHRTLIVLCPSSSPSQFLNTLTHELLHAVTHISDYYSIPLNTESPCYLLGSLAQASYPVAKHYL